MKRPYQAGHQGESLPGIVGLAGMAVMQTMLTAAAPIGQGPVGGQYEGTEEIVQSLAVRHQQAMHGVVADDEQTGLQQGAQGHPKQHQQQEVPRPQMRPGELQADGQAA